MAVEKITLNLIPTGETPTIHAAQFDKERAFQIELKEGEDDFSPTGYDIELQVRKVDNNIVTAVPSQVSSNIVTFLTTEQMTACSGTNLAELQISKNNMSIATLHFYLVVQRDVLAGGLSSQSEIYDLEEQIAAIVPEVIGDEYYTADQVDEKIAEIPTFDPTNYYDKTQLYTKTETNGLLSQKANTSSLSTVAFTGSYDDLVDHPVIPDVSNYYTKLETYSQAEVNTLLSTKADTSSLSTVATSGSYDDLSDKPTIPGNASVLPISASDSTNTKDYIDSGLSGKQNTISDSGWLPLPLASGVSNYGDLVSNYRKIGNVVYYNIWVEKSGLSWGSQVATMPSGYRPLGETTSSGRYGNGICNFSVATNGSINFLATTNTSSSDYRMFASGCFAI